MDEFVETLLERASSASRIQHHRREPARSAEFADLDVHRRVEAALDSLGVERLYRHQAEAVEALRAGRNVVVSTPTASGKSLTYTIPAIEGVLEAGRRTLYVAPTRALINDQAEALGDFVDGMGFGPRVEVARYTGQQSQHERRRIREADPHVLLTTPDMLHLGILPHAHRLWEEFVRSLDLVVIDEVHEYRGIFGSHVALLLRRLRRVCERFGADPQYVCCSATIGNPVEHAAAVTGRPADSFALVDEDSSAAGPRHWLFWNPPLKRGAQATDGGTRAETSGSATPDAGGHRRSPHPETARLFCDLLQRGYQTLVFAGSRQNAERYAQRSASLLRERGEADLAERVAAYQAALTDERRERIEGRLQNGDLRGVWSTNALELGIDVGSLDAVLLDGYPGTRMETHQRAGRAGRGADPSLVALVGGRDQLDQYVMANPGSLFDAEPERAVVNPANEELLPGHVACAARENWLRTGDEAHFGGTFPDVVAELTEAGELERRHARPGIRWTYDGEGSPHQSVSLRSIDEREIRLVDAARDRTIATLSFGDALRDAHPGAVYYHQGRTYQVADLQVDRGRALLSETNATHYTRALRDKQVTVEADLEETTAGAYSDVPVRFAEVTIREQIDSYVRYDGSGDDDGTVVELPTPLPETTMRTQALYFTIPPGVQRAVQSVAAGGASGGDGTDGFLGAIHAVEHGMISLFPLELLCDRRDVGGLSTNVHPHTGRATIFVHDGHPGGVGLARGGYDAFEPLLDRTREMIAGCPCESGCPACVQSPHCGNANDYLEKDLAVALVDELESSDG